MGYDIDMDSRAGRYIDNKTDCLAKELGGIKLSLTAIAEAISKEKQTEIITPKKSTSFPFLPVGFFLLVSAASAYYYREKIKRAFQSNSEAQASSAAALTVQYADAATQTEQPIQPLTSTASTETTTTEAGTTQSIRLPAAAHGGLFSASTTGNSSPEVLSFQNSPTNAPVNTTATEQGGWFPWLRR